jgi:hypothetical protein
MAESRQERNQESRTGEPAARYHVDRQVPEVWAAFEALSPDQRGDFLARLVEDDELREDLLDSIVMVQRRGQPSRPYEEFVEELRREGRL